MRARVIALGLGLLGVACHDDERRPYTPFTMSSGAGNPSSIASSQTPPTQKAPFKRRDATIAKQPKRKWILDGFEIVAPDGSLLESAIVADFNNDGSLEAIAWIIAEAEPTRTANMRPQPATLWLFEKGASKRKVAGEPGFVPTGPSCKTTRTLTQTGRQTVSLSVSASCQGNLIPRAPTRGMLVIRPLNRQPVVFGLRIADAAKGETLSLSFDTQDIDGDGRDDVKLTAGLSTDDAPPVEVELRWLDRTTGLARDPAQPATAFQDMASVELVRSDGVNTSRAVIPRVEKGRRLHASLCDGSGVTRVHTLNGTGLPCVGLEQAFDWFAEAETQSRITQGNIRDAFGVLERADWFHPSLSKRGRKAIEKRLLKTVDAVKAKLRAVDVKVRGPDNTPRYSPLRFEDDGSLLVLGPSGVQRIGRDDSVEYIEDEVDPWPMTVIGPSKDRFLGVAYPCESATVMLLRSGSTGMVKPPILTDLLAPRPGACGGRPPDSRRPSVLGWGDDGPIAIVHGHSIGKLPTRGAPGAAVSTDGRFVVAPTALGVLITGPGQKKPSLWSADELPLPLKLQDCVIHTDGKHTACIRNGAVVQLSAAD